MLAPRRQTIDTDERVTSFPNRSRSNAADNVSETNYSTTTTNTLAGFLARGEDPQDARSKERVTRLRRQNEEARAAINALNQFIFVAGHTFKGRQLNQKDQKRLCEAAEQVGLSLEVVEALVHQTSNKNAVLNYCMASDDAFARKMKKDPQLSRLLEEGGKGKNGDKFDVADSVWRVFMHKIVQQFLKEHDMQLSDVMSKESLTSRLYEEAIRNEGKNSSVDLGNDQAEFSRIRLDYTKERKKLIIPEDEAKLARQQAEANMNFQVYPEFGELIPAEGQDYFADGHPIAPDDILSLRPGVYPPDDTSTTTGAQHRNNSIHRRQSVPTLTRRKPEASEGEEEVSAVKRGLALFGKSQDGSEESSKCRRRKSLEALEKSKVSSSRARFEAGIEDQRGTERPAKGCKQRHSLTVLQESKLVNFETRVRENAMEEIESMKMKRTAGDSHSARKAKKLNPNTTKRFEGSDSGVSLGGHKPDKSPSADVVNIKSGGRVKSARQLFQGRHVGEINDGESRPVRPSRTKTSSRHLEQNIESGHQRMNSYARDRVFEVETLPDIDDVARNETEETSRGDQGISCSQRPTFVVVQTNSGDSNGVYSSLTQSSSSSQDDPDSRSPRRPKRSASKRISRSAEPKSRNFESSTIQRKPRQEIDDIDSMGEREARESPKAPRRRETSKETKERQSSNRGPLNQVQSYNRAAAITPHYTVNATTVTNPKTIKRDSKSEVDSGPPSSFTEMKNTATPSMISSTVSSFHGTNGKAWSKASPTAPTAVTNVPSFSDARQDTRAALHAKNIEMRDHAPDHEYGSEPSRPIAYEVGEGWVDFGKDFIVPPGRISLGERSGRGLSEGDNDSLRQPGGRSLSSSPAKIRPQKPGNCAFQNQQSARAVKRLDVSEPVENWSRKTATLLRDDDQPEQPGTGTKKPSKVSTVGRNEVQLPGSDSDQENSGDRQNPDDGWTKFRGNPFSKPQREDEGVDECNSRRSWQLNGPNPASMSTSSDPFNGGENVSLESAVMNADTARYVSKAINVNESHRDPSVAVRSMNVNDSIERFDRLQRASTPKIFRGSKAQSHADHFYRQPHIGGADHALHLLNEQPRDCLEGDSLGLYGNTETTRSMSSESDFDAVNAYHESDKRRIGLMQASEFARGASNSTLYPSEDRDSYSRGCPQQPDGPLVSKRGSRVSDVIGNLSRSRYAGERSTLVDSMSIRGQGTGFSSHVGLNSLPGSTLTSNLDTMPQMDVYVSHDLDDRRQPMVNCQAEPSKTCQMSKEACIVGGVPILEASYQPMNGGPPTTTPTVGSASFDPDSLSQERKSYGRQSPTNFNSHYSRDIEVLSSYLNSYEYESKNHRSSLPPDTPTGIPRPSFASKRSPGSHYPPRSSHQYGSMDVKNSSSTLSDILHGNVAPIEEEDRDDRNYQNYAPDLNSRDRYLDTQPGFDEPDQGPTSPTQLRSADSESTVDEEDIRRAAERRGISPDVVEVLISQSNSKIRRAPLKGPEEAPPLQDHSPSHEAPIDSDTCRPASARHLRKAAGPDSFSGYEQGTSWDSIAQGEAQGQYYEDYAYAYAPDPSPREAQVILAALQENAADATQNRRSSIPGMPELPEGATEEELNLLNRFIEVAAGNFEGKKLSADSEKRVRAAAEKVGLSQKFVDQLLVQANANNEARQQNQNSPVPSEVDAIEEQTRDDASTYYTYERSQFTRSAKKRARDVGCNALEQWDYLSALVRGWANCGNPADVHHEDEEDDADDGSSISSSDDPYRDELTRKLRKAQKRKTKKKEKKKQRKSHPERRGFV